MCATANSTHSTITTVAKSVYDDFSTLTPLRSARVIVEGKKVCNPNIMRRDMTVLCLKIIILSYLQKEFLPYQTFISYPVEQIRILFSPESLNIVEGSSRYVFITL